MAFLDEFNLLIKDYLADKISSDLIVSLMLENVSNEKDFLKCITKFRESAEKKNQKYDYAFSFAMLFWHYYSDDLDRALEYNIEAENLYKQLPDYTQSRGYLSVLNNFLIAYNSIGDIEKAYEYARAALTIVKSSNMYQYITPFSNNFSYLLAKLGLSNLALNNLRETINNLTYISKNLVLSALDLYIICLHEEKLYEESYKWILEIIKKDKEFKTDKKILCLRFLLDYHVAQDEKYEAKRVYNEMQLLRKSSGHLTIDERVSVSLSYAHYFVYMNDLDEAEEAYDYIYENIYNFLGNKSNVLSEISDFYASINDYEKAYKVKNDAEVFYKKYLRVVSKYSDIANTGESFDSTSYKILYNNIRKLTLIFNKLNPLSSTIDISRIISTEINEVLGSISCELFFTDPDTEGYDMYVYHNGKNSVIDFSKFTNVNIDKVMKEHRVLNVRSIDFDLAQKYEGPIGRESILMPFCDDDDRLLGVLWVSSNSDLRYENDETSLLPLIGDHIKKILVTLNKYSDAVSIATIDYLTQVYNRHGLEKRMNEIRQKHSYYDLVVFDLDNFKGINDKYGHLMGDEVLKDFAYQLSVYFRSENVARFGGEEFIVVSTMNRDELENVLEMFRKEINSRVFGKDDSQFSIGFSAGVARCNINNSYESTLHLADTLLYKSKNKGKGKTFFDVITNTNK